jgi:non-ribosomal peptide synthetase component F
VWLRLEDLLAELWSTGPLPPHVVPALLRVFERHPATDGAGVLWSIVHGIESLPYDVSTQLRESYERVKSEMCAVMLQRERSPS